MNSTNIIFRKDKKDGEIVAVFLEDVANLYDYGLTCYVHTGQHTTGNIDWIYRDTVPATQKEYDSLLSELTTIYSDTKLVIKTRLPKYTTTLNVFHNYKRGV